MQVAMLEQLQSIPAVLDDHCAGIPPVVLKLQSLSRFEESRAPKLEGRGHGERKLGKLGFFRNRTRQKDPSATHTQNEQHRSR